MSKFAAERIATYVAALAIAIVSVSSGANGIVIRGIEYVAHGPSETMTAVFTTPDGGVSTNSYSGFVEIVVSGEGASYFACLNDAFYFHRDDCKASSSDAGYYQLTFNTTTLIASDTTHDAVGRIVYDVDANVEVVPTYTPLYRADHTYDVILDVGAIGAALHFGVADGYYVDNSGAYTLTLRQMEARSTVAEPATLALLGLGLAGLGFSRRKQ